STQFTCLRALWPSWSLCCVPRNPRSRQHRQPPLWQFLTTGTSRTEFGLACLSISAEVSRPRQGFQNLSDGRKLITFRETNINKENDGYEFHSSSRAAREEVPSCGGKEDAAQPQG